MDLAIRLLGPVELCRDGTAIAAGGPTQRAVLAILAVRAGQPVGIGELVDGIWGESDESSGGARSIWPHVSRIRATLRDGKGQPITRVPGGYRLEPGSVAIDARDFEQLVGSGRKLLVAGDAAAAASTLGAALALWRGPALMDLRDFPFAPSAAARYEELRVDAAEERIEARLTLGDDLSLVPELHALIDEQPYRERLHGQLMLALYRAGQQAAALDAYRAARARLAVELGVEPGPELERLHRQILAQADTLVPHGSGSGELPRPVLAPSPRPRIPAAPVLIGRDDQLAELEKLAHGPRLLTLTGTGGSGKTSLALALVHRLAPRFRDGAAFVDLAAVAEAEQVLPAIATALGVSQREGSLRDQLADYLAEHRLVIVLDNVEHVLEAGGDLAQLLGASSGLVVATSRSPLGLRGEHVVIVPPLAVPAADDRPDEVLARPATQLFLRAAASAGGDVGRTPAEIEALARICVAVDGLPLALELAAAQTRAEAVPELAAHLAERLPRLQTWTRDAPARQRTIDGAIGWSIDRLASEQREYLTRLTVFSASFTASGASRILGLAREPTIDSLTELLDASLVTRQPSIAGEARFRILEPVRAVARARADLAALAEAAASHAAFIRSEIDRLSPLATGIQRPEDLALLRAEHPDLMATLGHLVRIDPEGCAELAYQLVDYWQWTGREIEAKRVADELLASGGLSGRATCLALALSGLGGFLLGRQDEIRETLERSLDLAADVSDEATSAFVRFREARFGIVFGELDRARVAARAAASHARRAGDERVLALSLALGSLSEPDTETAGAWIREALDIARARSMAYTELWAMVLESLHLDKQARLAEAVRVERDVLELATRFGAPEAVTLPANNLAEHLIQSGSIEEARGVLLAALRTADRIGHRIWAALVVGSLGEVEAAVGRWEDALTLITASRVVVEKMGLSALRPPGDTERLRRLADHVAELLDSRASTVARARGEGMTYREAVDLAFEVNGILPRPERGTRRAERSENGAAPLAQRVSSRSARL